MRSNHLLSISNIFGKWWFVMTECCYAITGPMRHRDLMCADESTLKGIPIYCGVGPCNIFGCNCDGVRRKSRPYHNSTECNLIIQNEKMLLDKYYFKYCY